MLSHRLQNEYIIAIFLHNGLFVQLTQFTAIFRSLCPRTPSLLPGIAYQNIFPTWTISKVVASSVSHTVRLFLCARYNHKLQELWFQWRYMRTTNFSFKLDNFCRDISCLIWVHTRLLSRHITRLQYTWQGSWIRNTSQAMNATPYHSATLYSAHIPQFCRLSTLNQHIWCSTKHTVLTPSAVAGFITLRYRQISYGSCALRPPILFRTFLFFKYPNALRF